MRLVCFLYRSLTGLRIINNRRVSKSFIYFHYICNNDVMYIPSVSCYMINVFHLFIFFSVLLFFSILLFCLAAVLLE